MRLEPVAVEHVAHAVDDLAHLLDQRARHACLDLASDDGLDVVRRVLLVDQPVDIRAALVGLAVVGFFRERAGLAAGFGKQHHLLRRQQSTRHERVHRLVTKPSDRVQGVSGEVDVAGRCVRLRLNRAAGLLVDHLVRPDVDLHVLGQDLVLQAQRGVDGLAHVGHTLPLRGLHDQLEHRTAAGLLDQLRLQPAQFGLLLGERRHVLVGEGEHGAPRLAAVEFCIYLVDALGNLLLRRFQALNFRGDLLVVDLVDRVVGLRRPAIGVAGHAVEPRLKPIRPCLRIADCRQGCLGLLKGQPLGLDRQKALNLRLVIRKYLLAVARFFVDHIQKRGFFVMNRRAFPEPVHAWVRQCPARVALNPSLAGGNVLAKALIQQRLKALVERIRLLA